MPIRLGLRSQPGGSRCLPSCVIFGSADSLGLHFFLGSLEMLKW